MKTTVNQTLRRSLLAVLAAIVLVNVSSVTTDTAQVATNLQGFVHSKTHDEDYIASSKLLRVHNKEGGTSEERMNTGISKLLNGGASVDDALKFLIRNNKGVDNLITNKHLKTIIDYVKNFNLQNPGNGASTIKSMTAVYGDDVVAKSLQLAKKDTNMDSMAEHLLGELRVRWLTNKQSPADVFKLLKLDDAASNPLSSPNLEVWASYLKLYNYHTRYTNGLDPEKQATMIKTFTAAYGDEALAKMLNAAKADSDTVTIASKLQLEQFTRWMVTKHSPNKVFDTIFMLDPRKPAPEPYKSILEEYLAFYKLHRNQK